MSVKLLTEHHLEFLSLNGGCTGLSESTLVKTPHNHPDSSVCRASAFGVGGRGFESWRHHTKGVKNGTSSSLADAPIKGIVLGR